MENAIASVNHATWKSRVAAKGIGAILLLTVLVPLACTSGNGHAPAAGPSRTTERVIPIHGAFVGDGSVGGHIDAFASHVPVEHSRVELYVKSFPTEEFDANLVRVTALGENRYVADFELARPDPRIQREMRFAGFIFSTHSAGTLAGPDSDP